MNPEFPLGAIAGKFLPPHRGHHLLIDTAASRCGHLAVFVCEKPSDPIPGPLRAGWLREAHPTVDVRVIDDRYDENDSRIWAENTIRWLGRAPDAVFTSESYGETWAGHLGCRHVMVDRQRLAIPCSGTAVRSSPFAMWEFLSPPVRAWYAARVVIVGAESTGTTTLAADLAGYFRTPWVAEYGREYSAAKWARGEHEWSSPEFLAIAREQTRREDSAAREANRLLICDTNAFATILWHRRYMDRDDPALTAYGNAARADLYLLTGDEIPFVQDGLRDGQHLRHAMHRWFEDALAAQHRPFVLLRGSREERLKLAIQAIHGITGLSREVLDP